MTGEGELTIILFLFVLVMVAKLVLGEFYKPLVFIGSAVLGLCRPNLILHFKV